MNTCKPLHPFNPDIEKILEHSSVAKDAKKAWDVQKYYWDAWYTTVGQSSPDAQYLPQPSRWLPVWTVSEWRPLNPDKANSAVRCTKIS